MKYFLSLKHLLSVFLKKYSMHEYLLEFYLKGGIKIGVNMRG